MHKAILVHRVMTLGVAIFSAMASEQAHLVSFYPQSHSFRIDGAPRKVLLAFNSGIVQILPAIHAQFHLSASHLTCGVVVGFVTVEVGITVLFVLNFLVLSALILEFAGLTSFPLPPLQKRFPFFLKFLCFCWELHFLKL